MSRYEYIRLVVDMGDLRSLNSYAEEGWKVVAMIPLPFDARTVEQLHYALLEREIKND